MEREWSSDRLIIKPNWTEWNQIQYHPIKNLVNDDEWVTISHLKWPSHKLLQAKQAKQNKTRPNYDNQIEPN